MRGWTSAFALALTVTSAVAHAAGYEKAIMFSGRWSGVGNAAAGAVNDSEALYFNPAGLGGGRMLDVSLNFSPTIAFFRGPVGVGPNEVRDSDTSFSPIFGGFVKFNPMQRLGIGLGLYVPAGNHVTYSEVDFSGANPAFTFRPDVAVDLALVEGSLGAGYEFFDGLRVGGGWRVSYVRAKIESATPLPATAGGGLVAVQLRDLNDWRFDGFRVGVQYAPKALPFGVGLNWRSPVKFVAEGKGHAQIQSAAGGDPAELPRNEVNVTSELPSQFSAGGFIALFERKLRFYGEYTWTRYEVNRQITITDRDGNPAFFQTGGPPLPVPSIPLDWSNQHNVRVGSEYVFEEMFAARLGYIATSRVTSPEFARPTLASPGWGHTIVLGGGTLPDAFGFRVNAALEWSFADGTGTNDLGRSGFFSTNAFAAHVGIGWAM